MDAYPHKVDGLHLLCFVRPHGSRGLHRLVSKVFEALGKSGSSRSVDPSLRLTLCAVPSEFRDIEEHLQEFDDADRRARSDRPALSVSLRSWGGDARSLPELSGIAEDVDVAVVPNLFGAGARPDPDTRDAAPATAAAVRFDPLLDEPTRLVPVGKGERASDAVSRVLLPSVPDRLLETWSTVSVRQFRTSAFGDGTSPDAVDFVRIRVSLGEEREFFARLHDLAHWVVTLDAFVGREQIAALDDAPDIVQVRTGVGANGAYRLVVSSVAGRDFVVGRLERRLRELGPFERPEDPRRIGEQVYDRACLLVPGIVLRSTGLGRTAAEMAGLVLARARVEQSDPAAVGPHGFQSWISLDEHAEWSGGPSRARADLARLRGRLDGDTLHLTVDVVEAKMRVNFDVGQAETQLERSVELLKAALAHDDDGETTYADAPTWRRALLSAVEQTSFAADGTAAATHVITPDGPTAMLGRPLRDALRDAVIEARVRGVLVSLAEGDDTDDTTTPRGHSWLRMTEDEARRLLLGLDDAAEYPLRDASSGGTGEVAADEEAAAADSEAPTEPAEVVPKVLPVADASTAAETRPEAEPRDVPEPSGNEPAAESPTRGQGGRTPMALARAQDLVDSLHRRKVEASPAGGDDAIEGPGFFEFRIVLGKRHRPSDVTSLAVDLQYDLGLAAGRLPRIYVDSGTMVLEIAKRDEERYYVEAENLWRRAEWPANALYAPLGVDVRDRVVGIDFSSALSPQPAHRRHDGRRQVRGARDAAAGPGAGARRHASGAPDRGPEGQRVHALRVHGARARAARHGRRGRDRDSRTHVHGDGRALRGDEGAGASRGHGGTRHRAPQRARVRRREVSVDRRRARRVRGPDLRQGRSQEDRVAAAADRPEGARLRHPRDRRDAEALGRGHQHHDPIEPRRPAGTAGTGRQRQPRDHGLPGRRGRSRAMAMPFSDSQAKSQRGFNVLKPASEGNTASIYRGTRRRRPSPPFQ